MRTLPSVNCHAEHFCSYVLFSHQTEIQNVSVVNRAAEAESLLTLWKMNVMGIKQTAMPPNSELPGPMPR